MVGEPVSCFHQCPHYARNDLMSSPSGLKPTKVIKQIQKKRGGKVVHVDAKSMKLNGGGKMFLENLENACHQFKEWGAKALLFKHIARKNYITALQCHHNRTAIARSADQHKLPQFQLGKAFKFLCHSAS